MQLFIREFNQPTIYKTNTDSYPLSTYFPYPMRDALRIAMFDTKYIRSTDYILGPVYRKKKDFQVGCTGTVEKGEEMSQAMMRELGEEIGIVPSNKKYMVLIKKYTEKERKFAVYESYIKHCNPVLDHQNGANLSRNTDSRNKTGCYIYGDKQSILSFLDSDNIYVYKSSDDIIGVGAIRAGQVAAFYGF